jgi:hypothetical protein
MHIIGDVDGRTCVIMDDMVDTANTLCKAATALKEHGAKKVVAYCTHPVLSGGAVPRIAESELDELVVTDTIPLTDEAKACPRIRMLSCAQLLAETMTRVSNEVVNAVTEATRAGKAARSEWGCDRGEPARRRHATWQLLKGVEAEARAGAPPPARRSGREQSFPGRGPKPTPGCRQPAATGGAHR